MLVEQVSGVERRDPGVLFVSRQPSAQSGGLLPHPASEEATSFHHSREPYSCAVSRFQVVDYRRPVPGRVFGSSAGNSSRNSASNLSYLANSSSDIDST